MRREALPGGRVAGTHKGRPSPEPPAPSTSVEHGRGLATGLGALPAFAASPDDIAPSGQLSFAWQTVPAARAPAVPAGASPTRLPVSPSSILKRSRRETLVAVPLLLFVNVLVFAGWQAARVLEPAGDLLTSHFLVSTDHLADGRFWSLLGATFSHSQAWHLVLNMIVLLSFGSILERNWGFRLFAGFYVAAGLASSLAHCAVSTYLLGRSDLPALGASGALAGLLVAYALSFPRQRLLLFGVIRMPAYIAAVGLVSLDIWGLLAQGSGGGLPIGHGAHLGGAAAGLLFYLAVIRARR